MAEVLGHYTISGSPIVKKNTMRVIFRRGYPLVYYTKIYQEWAKAATYEIMAQGRPKSPIIQPVILDCKFYMPTLRRVDLSALYEGIQDVLVRCRILGDDNFKIVAGHDGSRVLIDRKNPRTEVSIIALST